MVWIGADKRVTVVHDHMKKSTVDTPDDKVAVAGGRGQYVLELPAGAGRVCVARGSNSSISTFPVRDNGTLVGATLSGSCFCYFAAALSR